MGWAKKTLLLFAVYAFSSESFRELQFSRKSGQHKKKLYGNNEQYSVTQNNMNRKNTNKHTTEKTFFKLSTRISMKSIVLA